MKSGNLNFLEPSGPLQAYNGTALSFYLWRWLPVISKNKVFIQNVILRQRTVIFCIITVIFYVYVYGSMHRWSILIIFQRDATQSSLFIILRVHSTCFGCQKHPSSGVHKTVTTASGTGHIFCAGTSLQSGQVNLATLEAVSCNYRFVYSW